MPRTEELNVFQRVLIEGGGSLPLSKQKFAIFSSDGGWMKPAFPLIIHLHTNLPFLPLFITLAHQRYVEYYR